MTRYGCPVAGLRLSDKLSRCKAAIRTGRFAAFVEVGYPTRIDAARILTALITNLPGADTVNTHAVIAALPEHTTGSDEREIVRRAVLSADDTGQLSTPALLAEVGSGRCTSDGDQLPVEQNCQCDLLVVHWWCGPRLVAFLKCRLRGV